MANLVQPFKIMDGESHVTLHYFLQADGLEGELDNFVLLDPAVDLVPTMPKRQDLILKQIWYEVSGFTATLAFNALQPWPFWTLTPGVNTQHDWRFFGGIRDNSSSPLGLDSDGKLLISTNGFTSPSASGALVLWLEKRNRPNPQS